MSNTGGQHPSLKKEPAPLQGHIGFWSPKFPVGQMVKTGERNFGEKLKANGRANGIFVFW